MKAGFQKSVIVSLVSAIWLITSTAVADLVASYPFNEGIGTTIVDTSGKGHNGSIKGNVQWVKSRNGCDNALYFSGIKGSGHVDCGTWNPSEKTGQLTVALWIRWGGQGGDWQGVISKRNDWSADQMMWQIVANKNRQIAFYRKGNYPDCGDSTLTKDEWKHIAVTFDKTNVVFYVNGTAIGRDLFSFGSKTDSPIIIGAADPGGSNAFHGAIDEVCIFDHALSEDEVKQLYSFGSSPFASSALSALFCDFLQAKRICKEQGPQKTVAVLKKKIGEYKLWEKNNPKDIGLCSKSLASELYFLLAKAKEAARASNKDITEVYMKSALMSSISPYHVHALLWLFKSIPADDFTELVRKCTFNSNDASEVTCIAENFEARGNWIAFKLFLDGAFSAVNDKASFAEAIAEGLSREGSWRHKFLEYCRNKAELKKSVTRMCEKIAQEKVRQGNFLKAAEIYQDIVNQCDSAKDKIIYEFKVYECIFSGGQYARAVSELSGFIDNNKQNNQALVEQAVLLKGRAYMQLNKMDRAYETFRELMSDYPKTKQAAEANFLIGYCSMLKDKLEESVKVLNQVVNDYPQSPYASKARLCLKRIQRMRK